MARIEVIAGTLDGETIATLEVRLAGLPARTIDRPTALAWMKDGHSFIPVINGADQSALALVEVPGDGDRAWFIRTSPAVEPNDSLPFSR
jgi:hypothetical protein